MPSSGRGSSPSPVDSRSADGLLGLSRRLLARNVQEVLDGADALDLARLGAEILDQIGLLELASQVDDAVFDIDVDLSLRHVGGAEDLALDLARQRDVVGLGFLLFGEVGRPLLQALGAGGDALRLPAGLTKPLGGSLDRFLAALAGVADPEAKRKIIGRTFVDVFDEEAHKIAGVQFLAQGTIYPDVIESAGARTGKAHVIKSHHNVGGLPERMRLKLVEPLRELFKDEVRRLGVELGLPREMVYRHPFPGPGLGVRILGEVRKEYADLLRRADAIFIDELRKHELYERTSQAFAVFLPVRSVGVLGDGRHYDYVIALRAVETVDFMTAHWARLPYEFLAHVSRRIVNEVAGISRVVYDISDKPPATIEWE